MSRLAMSIGAGILSLAVFFVPAAAGEAAVKDKPPKPKPQALFEVQPPFGSLVIGDYGDRVKAFMDFLPKAAELAPAAKAEAARLRALPPPEANTAAQRIMAFVTGSLDALCAEAELMKSWKKGPPPSAGKVIDKVVAMDCKEKPIADVLAKASAGWGVTFELSPAARIATGAMDVDLEGAPSLKDFLKWLADEQGLLCGFVGEKIVLTTAASVKLQENIEKAGKEKDKKPGC